MTYSEGDTVSWIEHHEISAWLDAESEAPLHGGREDEAARLYVKAAEADDKAVADLNPSKTRTFGIPP